MFATSLAVSKPIGCSTLRRETIELTIVYGWITVQLAGEPMRSSSEFLLVPRGNSV